MPDVFQPMPPYALLGRVVTMDDAAHVISKGVIYIQNGRISSVTAESDPVPAGFEDCLRVDTKGTIYPGMIELHNHLTYNILPLWSVPSPPFSNRAQWMSKLDKRKFISGPMELLNRAGGYLAPIVRYVEAKCLLAGVTTSQGLTLVNASRIQKQYRGIVRNAEEPDDPTLPKAGHSIADVDASNVEDFLQTLRNQQGCYLLHLSEGIDEVSRKHFLNLRFADQVTWAITEALAGIHAAGLSEDDFIIYGQLLGAMVWSPLSNLMLYGDTAKVKAAKKNKVLIALGSDWSPSGSKNLLGELKVAKLYSHLHRDPVTHEDLFTDLELVRMVTSTPARILKWGAALGTLEAPKLADLVVFKGKQGDPYRKLINSTEADLQLVVIGGMPRYGITPLMQKLGHDDERWKIDDQERSLELRGAPDKEVGALTLKQAQARLKEGLRKLPDPPAQEIPVIADAFGVAAPAAAWRLALDNDGEESHAALAPLTTADVIGELWVAAVDIREVVTPLELDELTVAENPKKYLDRIKSVVNVPQAIRDGLPALYGIQGGNP